MRSREHSRERRRDEDQYRAADRERRRPLDRVADAAEISRQAERSRQKERANGSLGHAFAEHVDATDDQLRRRVATGINARGHDEGAPPPNATRWQSDAACVVATERLWRSRHAQETRCDLEPKLRAGEGVRSSFTERGRLADVLGPGWRADVYGRSRASQGRQLTQWSDDSHAKAVFRWNHAEQRWYLHTCYPDPHPLTSP